MFGPSSGPLVGVDLVLALEMPVDQDGPAILPLAVLELGERRCGDECVGRRLAARMRQDLDVVRVGPVDGVHDLVDRGSGIPGVPDRVIADRLVVRPVTPCRETLRRAVDGQLGATEAKAVRVRAAHGVADVVAISQVEQLKPGAGSSG